MVFHWWFIGYRCQRVLNVYKKHIGAKESLGTVMFHVLKVLIVSYWRSSDVKKSKEKEIKSKEYRIRYRIRGFQEVKRKEKELKRKK